MKTSNVKAFAVLATLGFLIQACGGDGGGSTIPKLNLDPDQITFVSPAAGATNVCRYTGFTIKIDSKDNCDAYARTNEYMRLYSAASIGSNPLELTDGAVFDSGLDECTIFFKAKRAMLPTHDYIMTIAGVPTNSIGANRNSISFTTSDLTNSNCGAGNAFNVTAIQVANAQSAVPRSTNGFENIGSFNDNGDLEMNWDQLTPGISIALGSLFRTVFGIGAVGVNPQIRITFNEDVEEFSVRNGVGLYKITANAGSDTFQVTTPVDLTINCPANAQFGDNSCVSYNGSLKNELLVRVPGSGLEPNSNYIILIGRGFVSLSGKNVQDAKYYDFTVSQ